MRPGNNSPSYRSLYKGGNLTDRERKNVILLDVIRRNGPIAKTDIARITKHNIVTVSNYVENYIKKKLIIEKGLDISSGGRRPELVELNPEWGCVIGVDISHKVINAVITFLNCKIIYKEQIARPEGHMEAVLAEATKLIRRVIENSKVDHALIKGIGVGIEGVIDKHAGTVRDTDMTRGSTIGSYESVKSVLEREFNVPVTMANDASLAVLGEKKLSLRIDDENVLLMFGDVGSGIITNNELFSGASWSAGEVQLNVQDAADLELPKWVLESNFFRSRGKDMGLVADVKAMLAKNSVPCKLMDRVEGDPDKITLDLIFESVLKFDEPVMAVVDKAVTLLGLKTAYLVNFLNPEVIVIGGGFEQGGDFVLNRIRSMIKKLVMEEAGSMVKVILSRLGKDAVALGASALMIQDIFAEV